MKRPKQAYRILVVALIALTLICLLAIAAGWFYVFQMSDQVSKLSAEALSMRRQSSKLSEVSINYQKVLPRKNVVYEAIPTTKDESTFMADLEAVAKANKIVINSSNIGAAQPKAAKTGEFSQTVKNQEYYELTIRYEVGGQYSDFTKLLSDFSNLRRLNKVSNVAVTSVTTEKEAAGRVKANFDITIYTKGK